MNLFLIFATNTFPRGIWHRLCMSEEAQYTQAKNTKGSNTSIGSSRQKGEVLLAVVSDNIISVLKLKLLSCSWKQLANQQQQKTCVTLLQLIGKPHSSCFVGKCWSYKKKIKLSC